ncbi:MAG: choice-of-anchor Q domain-containing protein [Patescibacteria group bacterium]|jgi:CSLREA domain-containing protein
MKKIKKICVILFVAFFLISLKQVAAETYSVTKEADTLDGTCDADCSLREAIDTSNEREGLDTIQIPSGHYTITIEGVDEQENATGDFNVFDDVTIIGSGMDDTIIDGNYLDRVFDLEDSIFDWSSSQVTIQDLTIQNGELRIYESNYDYYLGGGGILSYGAVLEMTNVKLQNNKIYGAEGGGAYLNRDAYLTNCVITGNYSDSIGGGLYHWDRLNIEGSTITNNTADYNGGGIYFDCEDPENSCNDWYYLRIEHSSISHNQSGRDGGGLYAQGEAYIKKTDISDNIAESGGGIYVEIYNNIMLNKVNMYRNSAEKGGAIYNGNHVQVKKSLLADNNAALKGGGIYNEDTIFVGNSTLYNNSAVLGGGIYNHSAGQQKILFSTIYGNDASNKGGAIYQENKGVYFQIKNSIIAENNCASEKHKKFIESFGNNISDNDSCYFNHESDHGGIKKQIVEDTLADNGGYTFTLALASKSPAIDAIEHSSCTDFDNETVKYDQRRKRRLKKCDAGAYEK